MKKKLTPKKQLPTKFVALVRSSRGKNFMTYGFSDLKLAKAFYIMRVQNGYEVYLYKHL